MHTSFDLPESYALRKGGIRNRARRKVFFSLMHMPAIVCVALLLPGATLAGAQQASPTSVAASLKTFAAYQPNHAAFPFAQPETVTQAHASPDLAGQAQPDQQSGLPDEPSAKKEGKPKPPIVDWYMRFVTGPTPKVLTPRDKAYIATRSIIDPFNVITILGEAGISVAADSHSAYGPGFPGFGRYVGVSFTEDITGEFFNTFLIPSLTHQDPRYHRMPQATMPHRIFHAIYQIAWTQSDYGKGMLNYGNLAGFAIDDEIGNLYVPGRRTNASATAQRYAIGLATAPIDNFISEFLPDVARHVHIQVVVVQRIINHIAGTDNNAF